MNVPKLPQILVQIAQWEINARLNDSILSTAVDMSSSLVPMWEDFSQLYAKATAPEQREVLPHFLRALARQFDKLHLPQTPWERPRVKAVLLLLRVVRDVVDATAKPSKWTAKKQEEEVLSHLSPLLLPLLVTLDVLRGKSTAKAFLAEEEEMAEAALPALQAVLQLGCSGGGGETREFIQSLQGLRMQFVFILVALCEERARSITSLCLTCLLLLLSAFAEDAAFGRSILPGVFSAMYKLCHSNPSKGSAALSQAVAVMVRLVKVVVCPNSAENQTLLNTLEADRPSLDKLVQCMSGLEVKSGVEVVPGGVVGEFDSMEAFQRWRVAFLQRLRSHFPVAFKTALMQMHAKHRAEAREQLVSLLSSSSSSYLFLGHAAVQDLLLCLWSCQEEGVVAMDSLSLMDKMRRESPWQGRAVDASLQTLYISHLLQLTQLVHSQAVQAVAQTAALLLHLGQALQEKVVRTVLLGHAPAFTRCRLSLLAVDLQQQVGQQDSRSHLLLLLEKSSYHLPSSSSSSSSSSCGRSSCEASYYVWRSLYGLDGSATARCRSLAMQMGTLEEVVSFSDHSQPDHFERAIDIFSRVLPSLLTLCTTLTSSSSSTTTTTSSTQSLMRKELSSLLDVVLAIYLECLGDVHYLHYLSRGRATPSPRILCLTALLQCAVYPSSPLVQQASRATLSRVACYAGYADLPSMLRSQMDVIADFLCTTLRSIGSVYTPLGRVVDCDVAVHLLIDYVFTTCSIQLTATLSEGERDGVASYLLNDVIRDTLDVIDLQSTSSTSTSSSTVSSLAVKQLVKVLQTFALTIPLPSTSPLAPAIRPTAPRLLALLPLFEHAATEAWLSSLLASEEEKEEEERCSQAERIADKIVQSLTTFDDRLVAVFSVSSLPSLQQQQQEKRQEEEEEEQQQGQEEEEAPLTASIQLVMDLVERSLYLLHWPELSTQQTALQTLAHLLLRLLPHDKYLLPTIHKTWKYNFSSATPSTPSSSSSSSSSIGKHSLEAKVKRAVIVFLDSLLSEPRLHGMLSSSSYHKTLLWLLLPCLTSHEEEDLRERSQSLFTRLFYWQPNYAEALLDLISPGRVRGSKKKTVAGPAGGGGDEVVVQCEEEGRWLWLAVEGQLDTLFQQAKLQAVRIQACKLLSLYRKDDKLLHWIDHQETMRVAPPPPARWRWERFWHDSTNELLVQRSVL
eukprot:gene2633-2877_t